MVRGEPPSVKTTDPKVALERSRKEFFALNVPQLLNNEQERNREAINRARQELQSQFSTYRNGVPQFAEDLTTLGTRYRIMKTMLSDWWSEKNEARKVTTDRFAKFVASDSDIQKCVTEILTQFSSDLEANRNKMLTELEVKVATASLSCASTDMGSTNIAGAFLLELQPLVKKLSIESPAVLALTIGGGFLVGEVAGKIVTRLLAIVTTRIATGAAARGSALAAGALAGTEGGSAVAPGVGTVIGLVGGLAAGAIVDFFLEKQFKQKVITECNALLTDMETAIWSDEKEGLEASFNRAIVTTREMHEVALRKVITGEAQ